VNIDKVRVMESASTGTDEASLTELFRQKQLELVRLALFFVGDRPTAEDVVQDVFARVCARWERIGERENALPYIRSAVINTCRSVLRKRAVIRRFGAEPGHPPVWSAEAEVVLGEERRAVLRALAALPIRRRQVLVLRYYFDLSEEEIARTLRISRGTVKSTAARALASLAKTLGDQS
jgi:RNA polymerase sigma-70 factor (sigma-E family)